MKLVIDDGVQTLKTLFYKSVQRLRLSRYPRIHTMENNIVTGFLKGQECKVMFDSGRMKSCMYCPLAKRLGLITGNEKKVKRKVNLW